jgi:hypothetical protein
MTAREAPVGRGSDNRLTFVEATRKSSRTIQSNSNSSRQFGEGK